MNRSRIPSPARSHGPPVTPRRYKPRGPRSVGSSPARLSGFDVDRINQQNRNSIQLSPLQKTVLNDVTDIEQPRRSSWWKKVDTSRDVLNVLDNNKMSDVMLIEELDMEVVGEGDTLDIPESSDCESINSFVVPQRRLFQKENQPENNAKEDPVRKEIPKKKVKYTSDLPDSSGSESITSIIVPKRKLFFRKDNKPENNAREEPVRKEIPNKNFKNTSDLRDSSGSESIGSIIVPNRKLFVKKDNEPSNNAKEEPVGKEIPKSFFKNTSDLPDSSGSESIGNIIVPNRKLFFKKDNKARSKLKQNIKQIIKRQSAFVVSDSDVEISDVQPTLFAFQKNSNPVRHSTKGVRDTTPRSSITTDMDLDDWKLLPSSTMVDQQIEIDTPPTKKAKLSKLSEDKESGVSNNTQSTVNKTKQSNKSVLSKNKSILKNDNHIPSKTFTIAKDETNRSSTILNQQKEIKDQEMNNESVDHIEELSKNFENNLKDTTLNECKEKHSEDDHIKVLNRDETCLKKVDNQQNDTIKISNEILDQDTTNMTQENANKELIGENKKEKQLHQRQCEEQPQEHAQESVNEEQDVERENEEQGQENQNEEVMECENEVKAQESENEEQVVESEKGEQAQVGENKEAMENENEGHAPENENEEQAQDIEYNVQAQDGEIEEEAVESENEGHAQENENEEQAQEIEYNVQAQKGQSENEEHAQENENEEQAQEIEYDVQAQEGENEEVAVESENEEHAQENENEEQAQEIEYNVQAQERENEEEAVESENEEHTKEIEKVQVLECEDEEQAQESENEESENENEELGQECEYEEQTQESEDEGQAQESENEETNQESDDEGQAQESENEETNQKSDNIEVESDNEEDAEKRENNEQLIYEDEDDQVGTEELTEENTTDQHVETGESSNGTHNTTGRYTNKSNIDPVRNYPHEPNHDNFLVAQESSNSIRKTALLKKWSMRPSMAPRDSTDLGDGAKNSSAEGSGWDSHRTTRKTLRQTFGADFTPRKSLRALVMEKSAKRQTVINETNIRLRRPQANSTELPPESVITDAGDNFEMMEESNHELSIRNRQTKLNMYWQRIEKRNMELNLKIEKRVQESLKASTSYKADYLNFVVRKSPVRKPTKSSMNPPKQRAKPKLMIDNLPAELVEDMKYKPPKRFKPRNASWVTTRLYKFLETKLEPKYDYKARVRAEKLVETLYNFVKEHRKERVASVPAIDKLKHEFARLNIVRTHHEFYNFVRDYLPKEVKWKIVPDLVNDIPVPKNLFGNIISEE